MFFTLFDSPLDVGSGLGWMVLVSVGWFWEFVEDVGSASTPHISWPSCMFFTLLDSPLDVGSGLAKLYAML